MIQINLIGHVGGIEAKASKNGETRWTEFSVAVNKKSKKGGEPVEKVLWFTCNAFGNTGENALSFVKKGHKVFVTGDLEVTAYINKQNVAVPKAQVSVRQFELLTTKDEAATIKSSVVQPTNHYAATSSLDEIPF
jgi:single-strand DNA-binding protein